MPIFRIPFCQGWTVSIRNYAYIRTWGYADFSSLKKGVWRYLILKDVMQNSLTSLAFYMEPRSEAAHRETDMSKVFRVTPKRTKRVNGTVLTPEMSVIVTTAQHTSTPFYNGAKELQEAYARLYAFDYRRACCSPNDFDFTKLD